MPRHTQQHDAATSNILAWTTHSANVEPSVEEEAGADADEPPDHQSLPSPVAQHFKRGPIRRGSEQHESLLTKALQSHSDEEGHDNHLDGKPRRRRSMTSNTSFASTAELTCDTGITTPARTSSPSPRLPEVGFASTSAARPSIAREHVAQKPPVSAALQPTATREQQVIQKDPVVKVLEKKRCISFACGAKPAQKPAAVTVPAPAPVDATPKAVVQDAPKRPCIRFACLAGPKPSESSKTDELAATPVPRKMVAANKNGSPTTKHLRSSSSSRASRSLTPRRSSHSPVAVRTKKWLTADSKELQSDCSRFHEFASADMQEDDWIHRVDEATARKITINDCMQKENAIRKLGKEAEEEAELEEEELAEEEAEEEDLDDEAAEEEDAEDDDEVDVEEDHLSGYGSDDEVSDGYNTDNEVGFAESDDEDDGLVLWASGNALAHEATPIRRQQSFGEEYSDSSAYSRQHLRAGYAKSRTSRLPIRPPTPDLPDSTDFVCGTLDEDRPLEEAYISRITARKHGQRQVIPQDIDPSFPTSEPEDEVEELSKNHQGSEEHVWLHGEIEDLHHGQDRTDRRRKPAHLSPKRMHSPPPKRHVSPAPKARGRSPRRLFDGFSPRRLRSPPPRQIVHSPPASLVDPAHANIFKSLAFRPGLTYTKSLPRAPAMFPQMKSRRNRTGTTKDSEVHVRSAIDIVVGLEQKRQRRKQKFYEKYCNKARKEKVSEKRPPRGQGCERMREVGLICAGKGGQTNFVLSV